MPSKEDMCEIENLKMTNEVVRGEYYKNSEFYGNANFIADIEPTASIELVQDIFTTLDNSPF